MQNPQPAAPNRRPPLLRRLPALPGVECFRTDALDHSFGRHTHDALAVGLIERGCGGFHRGTNLHLAPAGGGVLINPGDVHTGHAAAETELVYRMLFLDSDLLHHAASDLAADGASRAPNLPEFAAPVVPDPILAASLRALHRAADTPTSALAIETLLAAVVARLLDAHADHHPTPSSRPALPPPNLTQVRDHTHAHHADPPSLAELAALAGLSPWRLVRRFTELFGLPPHAYPDQVRVERAKRLLAAGLPVARVAHDLGFADQSHLTRRFKRLVGVTPARYALLR